LAKEKSSGLFPKNPEDVRLAEILEGVLQDLWNTLVHLAYNVSNHTQKIRLKNYAFFQKLEFFSGFERNV